jgi:hypothetical protein
VEDVEPVEVFVDDDEDVEVEDDVRDIVVDEFVNDELVVVEVMEV